MYDFVRPFGVGEGGIHFSYLAIWFSEIWSGLVKIKQIEKPECDCSKLRFQY